MLGLLLVPQLMRSRAGSETLLMFGATVYVRWASGSARAAAEPRSTWDDDALDLARSLA
jgi:hypothetical protein